jgi:hypothetical protein
MRGAISRVNGRVSVTPGISFSKGGAVSGSGAG